MVRLQVPIGYALAQGAGVIATDPILGGMLAVVVFWNIFAYFSGNPTLIIATSSGLPRDFLEIAVDFLLFPFLNAMVIRFVYDIAAQERVLSAGESVQAAMARLPTLVILHALFVIAGYIWVITPDTIKLLSAFPLLYLSVKLTFSYQVIVVGEADLVEALSTSWGLTEGNWWRVFVLGLVPNLIMIPFLVGEGPSRIAEGTVGWISSFWFWAAVTYAYSSLTAQTG
jgi:hypothetical protein